MNQQMYTRQLIELHSLLKDEQHDRITIIISGKQFIAQNQQLKKFPDTLLGNEMKRRLFYDKNFDVYRFDRHPSVFESILYYYLNSGILIRPPHIELEIFYEELRFWQINESLIETFLDEEMTPLDDIRLLPTENWRRIVWKTLTYPNSVRFPYGQLITGLSMSLTILSCIPFLSEIVPTVTELIQFQAILGVDQIHFPLYMRPSYIMEIFCIVAFTIELSLRIISAPIFSLILHDVSNFLDFVIDHVTYGFWLAFITLTTLGYGDIYPRSFAARLAASLCALIGIVVFSMPTTIVFIKYTTLIQNRWKQNRNICYVTGT
ncbi:hypothetical protein I4U23_002283 [Adineta vaga]|nr:hypothetical protein I4U23_002283 [Adineta vaga]